MNVDVEVSAFIDRPVDDVAAYAGDPRNAPEWYANIATVSVHGEGPLRLGTTMDFVARFLGRRLSYRYEIVDFAPGRRLVMRTSDGPFPMQTAYLWEAEGDGTRMHLRNTGSPTGFGAVAAPAMRLAMKAATTKDLQRLKGILEAGA
ncbi:MULTISPECIES: SRPBCC family protein [Arthrobacter]|uniref:SRPBCC family protein n=2 Tax=Arthrobacter TaxID=1663 RepID=A0ABU9KFJ4_9MICC|nr:SRPBCC family protein [Arthrobacter sp. YJM1]MDP5225650.1 SRPBCC family protein [Arthrobacter sp. YJM1]